MESQLGKMLQAMTWQKSVSIDFKRAALVVIDMQEYQARDGAICKRYGQISEAIPAYYLQRLSEVAEPNMVKVVELFREQASAIIYTRYASTEADESDLQPFMREINKESIASCGEPIIPNINDLATELVSSFKARDDEIVLQIPRSGSFTLTALDDILQQKGIEQLVIIGVLTHACVENTARIARDLGYDVTVVDDACATLDPQVHRNAIAAMALLGVDIVQTADLIKFR